MARAGRLRAAMTTADRPRERLARLGPRALLDAELLELLIGAGSRGASAHQLAQTLVSEAGELAALSFWEPADFARVRGLGPAKAAELAASATTTPASATTTPATRAVSPLPTTPRLEI